MKPTPEMIAAAWGAWKVRHKGSIGPGPGFVEAITAALSAMPAVRVKVKPLEWNFDTLALVWRASCPIGHYTAWSINGHAFFGFNLTAQSPARIEGGGDEEASKAAAQADYEARVLSAIEPGGVETASEEHVVTVEDVGDPEAWLFHEQPPQTNFPGNAHILFGLEAQGHIPAVEAALAEGADWQEIGLHIGWCGETAKQYYERYLARAALKGDEQ